MWWVGVRVKFELEHFIHHALPSLESPCWYSAHRRQALVELAVLRAILGVRWSLGAFSNVNSSPLNGCGSSVFVGGILSELYIIRKQSFRRSKLSVQLATNVKVLVRESACTNTKGAVLPLVLDFPEAVTAYPKLVFWWSPLFNQCNCGVRLTPPSFAPAASNVLKVVG